jgi:hypothetical protein
LDWRLGGPQSQSGNGGEEKNSQPLPGLKSPIIQSVAKRYTSEVSRLRIEYLLDYIKIYYRGPLIFTEALGRVFALKY